MKQFLLYVFLLTTIRSESDFSDAQLASKTISVPYSNAALTVYQHKLDPNRYYVAPIGIFRVDTMKIEKHSLTKIHGLKFSIVLTNSHIRDTVLQYLALKLSNCASTKVACTVELVPTDRVRIHWSTDSEYSIDKAWHTNTNLQDYVDFIIGCTAKTTCQQLHDDIEQTPETFVKGLQLEYMTTCAEMPSRIIQLAEQNTSANNGQIYINAHDKNELLTSVARDSIAQQTEDEGYQADDADSQTDLVKLLGDILISEQVTLNSHTNEAWKSLYWHENNQRPDETVKTLEKILKHLKSTNRTKSCNTTHTLEDVGSEMSASLDIPKEIVKMIATVAAAGKKKRSLSSANNNSDDGPANDHHLRRKRFLFSMESESHDQTDSKANYCLDDLLRIFKKNEKHVEWSGSSFKVKPMTVYRLNVGNYSDVAAKTIKKVKIKLRKNVHSIALRSSTTIIANISSKDIVPSAFGSLWISINLTELQRQFEEWKFKSQNELTSKYNELLSKYNELSLRHDKLNTSLSNALNHTRAKLHAAYDLTMGTRSTTSPLPYALSRFESRYNSTVTKLACYRRAKFEMKHITKYCDQL